MKKTPYKIRFNNAVTVDDINATLDTIDNAGGYCPCQVPSAEIARNYNIDKARFNLP